MRERARPAVPPPPWSRQHPPPHAGATSGFGAAGDRAAPPIDRRASPAQLIHASAGSRSRTLRVPIRRTAATARGARSCCSARCSCSRCITREFGSDPWPSPPGKVVSSRRSLNRRLYDTESSAYITLDRLAQTVRGGRQFEVVDAKSGEDITRQVLTQIIVDEEARGFYDLLPNQVPEAADRPLRQFDADVRSVVPGGRNGRVPAQPDGGGRTRSAATSLPIPSSLTRHMAMFEDGCRSGVYRQELSEMLWLTPSDVDQLKAELAGAPGQSRPAELLFDPNVVCRLLQRLR